MLNPEVLFSGHGLIVVLTTLRLSTLVWLDKSKNNQFHSEPPTATSNKTLGFLNIQISILKGIGYFKVVFVYFLKR